VTRHWTFRDYLAADGTNEILAWLNGLNDKRAKIKINAKIRHLEAVRTFREDDAKKLEGHEGLWELRVSLAGIKYRPLFCHGPNSGDLTLLIGAVEKNNRFDPREAPTRAQNRRAEIGKEGRTCEHDHS
jgi:putative component of toxin-antitoxin plasmid stabilization module